MQHDSYVKKIHQLDSIVDSFHRLLYTYLTRSTKFSLSVAQIFLLKVLEEKGTCTASALANYMGVTSGAVTSLADKLSSQGLILRERSKNDRRVVKISITDKGHELYKAVERERDERVIEILSVLTEEDVDAMMKIYQKLADNLKEIVDKTTN